VTVTIFTGASGHGAAAYYTKDCHKVEDTVFASTQRAELYALVMVLRDFPQQPINLYMMWWVFYATLKQLILVILEVKSYLIFSFSCVVWWKLDFILVL
jgi:hypothetical protein